MKFTVNRTELLAAAQNAERIAPRVSTIEILQCAYLQAEQDTLTVASGNLEIALEQQLPAQIESEGSVVVKAPLLSGMLRLLDGERVTFQMKNGKLVVSSGNAEYAIPVMDAAQYPRMEIPCPAATVPVSGIPSLTKRTAFAVSEDTTRPMLKCVNLIFGADGLQAVSTDSFRIASAKGDRESRGNISFLVPAASLEKLAGLVRLFEETDHLPLLRRDHPARSGC
jgi:DNA polymerase III, beta subunit